MESQPNNNQSQVPQNQTTETQPVEKAKRHRRSKNDCEGRKYQCEICFKSYLSAPALTNHKKTKHSDGIEEGEKKKRGRPKKDNTNVSSMEAAEEKFKNFFEKPIRKKNTENSSESKETLQNGQNTESIIDKLKLLFEDLYRLTGIQLFKNKIKDVTEYSFYKFIIENWNK